MLLAVGNITWMWAWLSRSLFLLLKHLNRNQIHLSTAVSGVMAEEKEQMRASSEELALPDEYPPPHTELNGKEGQDVSAATEEKSKDQEVKCSPNVLQMLKAAESRSTPQGQDREGEEVTENGKGELVTEALKTDMVSTDYSSLPDFLIPFLIKS